MKQNSTQIKNGDVRRKQTHGPSDSTLNKILLFAFAVNQMSIQRPIN